MRNKRDAYRIFVRKPGGRPICKLVYNVKMNIREKRLGVTDCIYLLQNTDQWRAFVKTIAKLKFP
jgi:hypothetical protein